MRQLLIPIILASTMAFSLTGCVHQREHDTRRIWADWNTLGQPAFFFEQKDHKPYHASRVGNFRWAYGKNPGHQFAFPYYIPPEEAHAMRGDPYYDPMLPELHAPGQPVPQDGYIEDNYSGTDQKSSRSPLLGPPAGKQSDSSLPALAPPPLPGDSGSN